MREGTGEAHHVPGAAPTSPAAAEGRLLTWESSQVLACDHGFNRSSNARPKGAVRMAQLSPGELVALIAGQLVAGRGDSSAQVISEAVEAAVRIVDAAEAAIAARHGR